MDECHVSGACGCCWAGATTLAWSPSLHVLRVVGVLLWVCCVRSAPQNTMRAVDAVLTGWETHDQHDPRAVVCMRIMQ
jgi:hypothetical protein